MSFIGAVKLRDALALKMGVIQMAHRYRLRRLIITGSIVWMASVVVLLYALARSAAPGTSQQNEYLPMPLETHLIGQREWLAGSTASLRIIVRNHDKDEPIANAKVRALLTHPESGRSWELFNERTNNCGTVERAFTVPSWAVGENKLSVDVQTPIGEDKIMETITVREEVRILLTTDKPIYQPSQTIHMRALCLNAANLKPAHGMQISFEVEDPKGNKVFRKREKTSQFGIASADFQLADEINLGNYTIRALVHSTDAKGEQRKVGEVTQIVKVDRYVLPKFKVELETSKRFYLPGEELEGTVKANYFFGKPVSDGDVTIKFSTFDVGWNKIAELRGRTDGEGVYNFKYRLPTHFVGLPLEQGKALLKIDVHVTDKAEHEEQITETLPIAKDAISIVVIPDSQALAKGIPNTLFIVTTYPDGTPAKTKVRVSGYSFGSRINWSGDTDEAGITEMQFIPTDERTIIIEAVDKQGNKGRLIKTLEGEISDEAILLRTDKAIAKVGDSLQLTVLSPTRGGTVYIDAIRGRQTILTKALEMNGTRGTMRISLTEQMMGTLTLHAYRITREGQIVRDTKVVYVNPASDLLISIKPNRDVYLPGKEAQVDFSVRDAKGNPTLTALGITIVDESVYALQEMQPGLEKVYFMLERELLKPRYEIHGFEPTVILREPPKPIPLERHSQLPAIDERRQKAARVLFAAAMPNLHTMYVNTWQNRARQLREKWIEHAARVYNRVLNALEQYRRRYGDYPEPSEAIDVLIRKGLLSRRDIVDPLGNEYRIELFARARYFSLIGAGPDGKFRTNDDVMMPQEIWTAGGAIRAAVPQVLGALGGGAEALQVPGLLVLESPPGIAAAKAVDFGRAAPEAQQIRIRQFFPETLAFIPQLITDEKGRASLNIAMADSITTWRLTAIASSLGGLLGSATSPLRVFQDFFVDIDLPVSLTQGDEVSIPVAIYNYLPTAQVVDLQLQPEDWFEPLSSTQQSVKMNAGDVGVVYFPIKVKSLGTHSITVVARGEKMSDAIKRQVLIVPNGKEMWQTISDTLKGSTKRVIKIPQEAIDGASTILVRVYGGGFSQVVDGLDKLLRMPFGCFEQTSSVTYPNVLVLDYMKRTKQINPEIQMKAEQYINLGYQRLLTFEVKGGGFSWFGNPPAHEVLTAYGLMEFNDMSKVFEVDKRVIERTSKWLVARQRQDGSWEPPVGGIREGVVNRQRDVLRTTAYITWALTESFSTSPNPEVKQSIGRAIDFLMGQRIESADDAYALAILANAFVGWDRNSPATARVVDRLADMAEVEGDVAYWRTGEPTFTYSKGMTADIETTALAAYALLKARSHPDIVNKALTYLVRNKDAFGTWHNTQATIWSLKALLLATEGATGEIDAQISIRCNGRDVAKLRITPEDSDIVRQVDLKGFVKEGENEIAIEWQGKGRAVYQIATRFYLPWELVRTDEREPLDISVDYDRRELSVNDTVKCTVTVRNNQPMTAKMVIVDVGIPPGFQVQTDDLAKLVSQKVIQRFNLTGRQVIIYLDEIRPGDSVTIAYHLKATCPIKASSGTAAAYEYYAPDETRTEAKPIRLIVR